DFYRRDAHQTIAAYHDFVSHLFPSQFVDTILMRYPAAEDAKVPDAVLRMFTDYRFITPTVLTARAASRTTSVYMYRFSRVSPLSQSLGGGGGQGGGAPNRWHTISRDA